MWGEGVGSFLCCGSILFRNKHAEKERYGGFTLVVLWLSVSLPHDAVGWSEVCDRGISWSFSLTFFVYC